MKFRELRLSNFGPYKGEQIVEFPTDPNRPVMVIFGDNLRGKTSLLRSLQWVLYGRALDRYSKEIDLLKLINMEAKSQNDWKMSVQLRFIADANEYDLRRVAEPRELISIPRLSRDLDVQVHLSKNGRVVRSDQVDDHINRFVPEQISRFYWFDSELLQEYETLLIEESEQGERIKEAIEHVLGVPALLNGRKDLRHLLKKAQGAQARDIKRVKALEDISFQSLRLQEDLRVHEEDRETVQTKLTEYQKEVSSMDEELSMLKPVQDIHRRVQSIKQELDALDVQDKECARESSQLLRDAWKDLLQPRVEARRKEVISELGQHETAIKKKGSVETQISDLASLLKHSTCPLCGADIDKRRREEFGSRLGELEAVREALRVDTERLASLNQELKSLASLTAAGVQASLTRIDHERERVAVKVTEAETEKENLEGQLRGHDIANIARLQKRKDGLIKLIARCEASIDHIRNDISQKTAKVEHLSKLMSKSPEARKNKSSREVTIYSGLEQVFTRSIDVLRERLRKRVAKQATTVFKQIITEKSYKSLEINKNYGLTIIDRLGRQVSVRSAGAEQIVAMSLISALNKTANRPGPVVIDTPFGRLDPKHRTNILEFVPQLAEQVVFLVHEGELDRNRDLQPIANKIGAVYEIERVSSSHSVISREGVVMS